jgi:hypothetical protein
LEAGITGKPRQHTNSTNGKDINQVPKHGYCWSPQQTINPRQTSRMQRKLQTSNCQRKELRHEFLLERAKIAASNNDQTLETAIKQLAHIEASIHIYALIKRVMHQTSYQPGLTSIRVPTGNGSYRTVINLKEIEEHLINRNLEHYTQAEHMAMAHHLICEKMGVSGMTKFCDQVLEATANLSYIPTTLQAIFQQLH